MTLDTFYLSAYKVTYGDFDVYVAAKGLPAHPPQTEDADWQRSWRRMRTAASFTLRSCASASSVNTALFMLRRTASL